jgi:hypothetical protein
MNTDIEQKTIEEEKIAYLLSPAEANIFHQINNTRTLINTIQQSISDEEKANTTQLVQQLTNAKEEKRQLTMQLLASVKDTFQSNEAKQLVETGLKFAHSNNAILDIVENGIRMDWAKKKKLIKIVLNKKI